MHLPRTRPEFFSSSLRAAESPPPWPTFTCSQHRAFRETPHEPSSMLRKHCDHLTALLWIEDERGWNAAEMQSRALAGVCKRVTWRDAGSNTLAVGRALLILSFTFSTACVHMLDPARPWFPLCAA